VIILAPLVLFLVNNILSSEKKPAAPVLAVVNNKIKKTEAKVVDTVDCGEIERIAEFKDGKLVMCRCWKSEKFPYCDGAHNAHNKVCLNSLLLQ
jgi:CDGSH-type Zn-finger protein